MQVVGAAISWHMLECMLECMLEPGHQQAIQLACQTPALPVSGPASFSTSGTSCIIVGSPCVCSSCALQHKLQRHKFVLKSLFQQQSFAKLSMHVIAFML